MKIRTGKAWFDDQRAEVEVNGLRVSVDGKLTLIREGLCNVRGGSDAETIIRSLNDAPSLQSESDKFCQYWPLVEIAARYWRWANDDNNAPWEPCEVETIKDPDAAKVAWQEHQRMIKATDEFREMLVRLATGDEQ